MNRREIYLKRFYLAKVDSNLANDEIDLENKIVLIDDNSARKMRPDDENCYRACEAYHDVHYHADGYIINEAGEIDINESVSMCVECCSPIEDKNLLEKSILFF